MFGVFRSGGSLTLSGSTFTLGLPGAGGPAGTGPGGAAGAGVSGLQAEIFSCASPGGC